MTLPATTATATGPRGYGARNPSAAGGRRFDGERSPAQAKGRSPEPWPSGRRWRMSSVSGRSRFSSADASPRVSTVAAGSCAAFCSAPTSTDCSSPSSPPRSSSQRATCRALRLRRRDAPLPADAARHGWSSRGCTGCTARTTAARPRHRRRDRGRVQHGHGLHVAVLRDSHG